MSNTSELRQKISNHFSLRELQIVVENLGVSRDEFANNKSGFILDMIPYFERRNSIVGLAKEMAKAKQNVDFSPWGAPPPVESLNSVMRSLISDAYNMSEISTMCFDIDQDLYSEVKASQSKMRSVELVVEYAIKNGVAAKVMNRAKDDNPYQHAIYFERIKRALENQRESGRVPAIHVEPKSPQKKELSADAQALVLVMRIYASGNNDDGALAKKTLESMGIELANV